ncbi:MAG: formylglycine-generating enzyme family protein, partial [Polyangiaceae bacterium]
MQARAFLSPMFVVIAMLLGAGAPRARAQGAPAAPSATAAPDAAHGWTGETMPKGMRKGAKKPVYVWKKPGDAKAIEIEMVYVPAGDFIMGTDDTASYFSDAHPRHTHPMPNGTYIGRNDVTWAQYLAFCNATGRARPEAPRWGIQRDHPVVNVSWDDAVAFCTWAGLRLPSEAEWEKAARGTDGRKYPWGNDDPTSSLCMYYSRDGTSPVGSHPAGASPCGALDMAGNVWQWCADWYDRNAYKRYANGDTSPPTGSRDRVRRGCSWYDDAVFC